MFDNETSAKEYFGDEFVNRIYSVFREQSESNFIFVHGTITGEDAEQIIKKVYNVISQKCIILLK